MERDHGSVVLAMLRKARLQKKADLSGTSGARYGLFLSFDRGMQVLVQALAKAVCKSDIRLSTRAQSVARSSAGWTIHLSTGNALEADAICLALPGYVSAQLLTNVNQKLAAQLNEIKYASTATINFAYRRDAIQHPLDGFGFVVPFVEKRSLIACTFSNVKFPGRAPSDHVLLRAFAGGALQPEMFALEESEMLMRVENDLRELLAITGKPLFAEVSKWQNSMPQYEVGHLDRVAALENSVRELPGLTLAGNAYRGAGIPDCIRSGETAAEKIIEALTA
jgi:protoporphyrinogen/coproporphyrinogen III oxidase